MRTRHLSVLPLLFAALFITGCAGDEMPQQPNGGGTKGNTATATTAFTGETQTPSTINAKEFKPQTRTAATHTIGNGASVTWTATDKIWVKDDAGVFQQSNAVTFPDAGNEAKGRFDLGSSTFTGTTHAVAYTNTASATEVEIKSEQTQSAPNNFEHLGASGDCGIAMATGNAGNYKFTLEHKASYLCLLPHSTNEYVNRSKLIKVEISADDDIAGTYTMAADGSLTLASDGSKSITVTTGTGFELDNTTTDQGKNAVYAVIAPGNHSLRIRYWLHNTTDCPYGDIEGTVTKYVTINCEVGKIHDVIANLAPKDYSSWLYWMWDAKQPYWYGHEWDKSGYIAGTDQPTVNFESGDRPYSLTDPDRWYHEGSGSFEGSVNDLFNPNKPGHVPNANEMSWYCMQGDPRWDADELWSTIGHHLYKGGIWLKKHDKISGFSSTVSADGSTDLRTTFKRYETTPSNTLPTVSGQVDYFYLPTLGYYYAGTLYTLARNGSYRSSSTVPGEQNSAYGFGFSSGYVNVGNLNRDFGNTAVPFE
ncbi:MAG: hypothetical protein ACTTJK_00400 [Phocaeicola sp.]|uniref:hypothetical protein n=1 Tax=Phocaeicola sp. TaxID=2773926 RepID=UPI003FA0044C